MPALHFLKLCFLCISQCFCCEGVAKSKGLTDSVFAVNIFLCVALWSLAVVSFVALGTLLCCSALFKTLTLI